MAARRMVRYVMIKSFGAVVVLGSMLALTGCVAGVDDLEEGDEPGGDEEIGSVEQEVTNGAVNAACAESLTLRSSPGGATIGTMSTGIYQGISKFYVSSTSGGWSYGYSYSLGKWGYAMASYLTTNYGESGTPGVAPYNYWCQRPDGAIWGGGIG